MNEKLIEKKLREAVKEIGGIALKFASSSFTGMPDRFLLLPGGRIVLVELKSTGKTPTPIQEITIRRLRFMGFWVEVIDSQETLDSLLKQIEE